MPLPTPWNKNKQVVKKLGFNISWQKTIKQWAIPAIAASGVTALTVVGVLAGVFQSLELATLDRFFRWRPGEAKDSRIVVITIDDADIKKLGNWPMSDAVLVQLLNNLKQFKPLSIGLDIYRDIPVEPGHQELLDVYQTTPNLIGIEKIVGDKIDPPPVLPDLDQVAISDVVVDIDGKLRRSLISAESDEGILKLSLGAKLALMYLSVEGIEIEPTDNNRYKIGKAIFTPIRENSGPYVGVNSGGFQILLNFRGGEESFDRLSLTEVLENQFLPRLISDRVVLIGSTADSLKDFVETPYSDREGTSVATPGVFIHAHAASQMMSAAIDGRPLLQVWAEPMEWLWILGWSGVGTVLGVVYLQKQLFKKNKIPGWLVFATYIVVPGSIIIGISYVIFLTGWWIPVVSPLVALTGSALVVTSRYNQQLKEIAFTDQLTKVPNRRYFDQYLQQQWDLAKKNQEHLSLILCDIDHFKLYNDFYGHQGGDECLAKVAGAMSKAVRNSDCVARYGGEEFVVVLPKTELKGAMIAGQRILDRVISLQVPHAKSSVGNYVSLSCGVADMIPNPESSPAKLIAMADEALYAAKEQGRARVVRYE